MIFGRRRPDDALRVHAQGEESWRCDLPAGTLAARFLTASTRSQPQWGLVGQLSLEQLAACWPDEVSASSARLLQAGRRRGLTLDVDLPAHSDPQSAGTTLREILLGLESVASAPTRAPTPVAPIEVIAEPVDEPLAEAVDEPHSERVELVAAAGEVVADDDRRLRPEDLAWLNPGDLLHSDRHGSVRVKRVEDEARNAVVQAADGELLILGFDELAREFAFED